MAPHAADRLHPAERLLDALADSLARRVAGVARGAAIDGRPAQTSRDVRAHVHGAALIHEVRRIIGLVGTERDGMRPIRVLLDHRQRGKPLGVAGSLR